MNGRVKGMKRERRGAGGTEGRERTGSRQKERGLREEPGGGRGRESKRTKGRRKMRRKLNRRGHLRKERIMTKEEASEDLWLQSDSLYLLTTLC